jgi:N-acetylglutamate synthase-like GNAT family acetyltransferase
MKSKEIEMSIEEFHLMEHPFGWKEEYWDGKAHLTPREHIVTTKLDITKRTNNNKNTNNFNLVPIAESYKAQMIEAFFETFKDSVEFCNWESEQIEKHAEKNINNYFEGKRGKPLSQSVMVLDSKNNQKVLGLALFLYDKKEKIRLDLLLVRPEYQGKKMATEMVSKVVNYLDEQGITELFSDYHICNEGSRDWHHGFGFKDVYDQLYIRLKYSWYRHEIWRHQKLDLTNKIESLEEQMNWWYSQLEENWRY